MGDSDGNYLACAYGYCLGYATPAKDNHVTAASLGVISNIAYTSELFGWIFDSDCRKGGGAGAPGCDYGSDFDVWVANQGYDTAGDSYLLPGVAAAIVGHRATVKPGPRALPMGFPNGAAFKQFGGKLQAGLKEAGHGEATAIFQGSAVTGKSFRTQEPFDSGRTSDYDIALAGPEILASAKKAGIGLRSKGTRTGPLKPADTQKLGLTDL